MDKFSELAVSQILQNLKAKLKPFESYGIEVNIVEPKYSDIYMEAKVTFKIKSKSQEAEHERKRFFEENCESVGLKPEDFGKVIKVPNSPVKYEIAGLDFHEEEPVLVKKIDETDEEYYRMSVVDVKKVLK